jgi:hypothetical protein
MPKFNSTNCFKLPSDLADTAAEALKLGHKIKLSNLLLPLPTYEELAEEAALWEIADEIEA